MLQTAPTAFCTIVTASHLDYALALCLSLRQFETEAPFFVLLTDEPAEKEELWSQFPQVYLLRLADLAPLAQATAIIEKYRETPDFMRWSLKSVLMLYLLEKQAFDEVVFLDCDLCFYQSIDPIKEQLSAAGILLSPHWRCQDPAIDSENFKLNFTDGMYNGGFLGATQAGIPALKWWRNACLYRCERTREEGLYVDQKFLDLLPAQFPSTRINHHRGCNVANWNLSENRRTQNAQGEILILDKWPIIFIHYSASTVRGILKGKDPLLSDHLDQWKTLLDQAADILGRNKRNFNAAGPQASLPKRILNKLGIKANSK
ncbi:MAG: hypothetical protein AAF927_02025 [Bacteroidota bacterium]